MSKVLVGSTEPDGLTKSRISSLKIFCDKMEAFPMNDNLVIQTIDILEKFIIIDCCSYIKCYVVVWHIDQMC